MDGAGAIPTGDYEEVNAYLDSSVVLRLLLDEPNPVADWGDWEAAISSELTKVEVWRGIHRLLILRQITAEEFSALSKRTAWLLAQIDFVRLDSRILRKACEPFTAVVGALDAIHLSSAILWAQEHGPLVFFTHDRQLGKAAQAYGFDVQP